MNATGGFGFGDALSYTGRMTQPTTLERAFALARSGDYATVNDIRLKLKSERLDQVDAHLAGPALARQLRRLCEEARRARAA